MLFLHRILLTIRLTPEDIYGVEPKGDGIGGLIILILVGIGFLYYFLYKELRDEFDIFDELASVFTKPMFWLDEIENRLGGFFTSLLGLAIYIYLMFIALPLFCVIWFIVVTFYGLYWLCKKVVELKKKKEK